MRATVSPAKPVERGPRGSGDPGGRGASFPHPKIPADTATVRSSRANLMYGYLPENHRVRKPNPTADDHSATNSRNHDSGSHENSIGFPFHSKRNDRACNAWFEKISRSFCSDVSRSCANARYKSSSPPYNLSPTIG